MVAKIKKPTAGQALAILPENIRCSDMMKIVTWVQGGQAGAGEDGVNDVCHDRPAVQNECAEPRLSLSQAPQIVINARVEEEQPKGPAKEENN